eukprot:7501691-Pyramimonas_sp.AAC.1
MQIYALPTDVDGVQAVLQYIKLDKSTRVDAVKGPVHRGHAPDDPLGPHCGHEEGAQAVPLHDGPLGGRA